MPMRVAPSTPEASTGVSNASGVRSLEGQSTQGNADLGDPVQGGQDSELAETVVQGKPAQAHDQEMGDEDASMGESKEWNVEDKG